MAAERKNLFLFLISFFVFSFFYLTEGVFPLHKTQSISNVYNNKMVVQKKQASDKKTVVLSFNVKKDNYVKKNSRSRFCEKIPRSIFQDIIVRNLDHTYHYKSSVQLLHHFEYEKDMVYEDLFSFFASICDVYTHPSDYYIYTLREIIV